MSDVNAVDRWWKALIGSGLSTIEKFSALNDIGGVSSIEFNGFGAAVTSATGHLNSRVGSNEVGITALESATGFLDTGKANESVISDYLGPVDLTSAASISWDINNGNQANLTGLSINTTVTLSNLENGETFSLAGTQGGTGKYSLSIDMAGMDVKGDTTSIAELNSDEYFMVAGRRMNTGILLSTITYPT